MTDGESVSCNDNLLHKCPIPGGQFWTLVHVSNAKWTYIIHVRIIIKEGNIICRGNVGRTVRVGEWMGGQE